MPQRIDFSANIDHSPPPRRKASIQPVLNDADEEGALEKGRGAYEDGASDLSLSNLLGQLRVSKEVTEIGCLLMLNGFAEIVQPLVHIAKYVNGCFEEETGEYVTDRTGLPFGLLFGYICCVAIGVAALLVGYAAAFGGNGNAELTRYSNYLVQTAYILTVTSCMKVTRVASRGGSFVKGLPLDDDDEEEEPNNPLLAAMGVLLIISMWFGMLGSISVLLGGLEKFQLGQGHLRDGTYYKSRLTFYSLVLWLGGFAQTVIGVHLYRLHGPGPIVEDGSSYYMIAMLVVSYPSLSIVVGVVQMMNGIWGILKRYGVCTARQHGGAFVTSIWMGWLIQLVLQIIVQPAILPGAEAAGFSPELAAFSLGMNFMPAYLDSKSQGLAATIGERYYHYGNDESNDDSPPPLMEATNGSEVSSEKAPDFSEPFVMREY